MQKLQQSEATAAQRRIFFHAVDATDGIAAETALTGTGFFSKNGATPAASSGSLVELNATNMPGRYYIEATATELDTLGVIEFRYKAAACAEVVARAQVVPYDPYDAVRMGLTALPNAAAEAAGGLYTRGTGAGQINQPANGIVDVNVEQWLDSVVNALIAGRVDSSTGAMAADVVTATAVANGAIDAATFAADAINAAALATDAVEEIADQVWNEDATGHQTQGSFGQAIGDPVADPSTIWGLTNTNLDALISSRAIAGDAMDLIADAVDAAAVANGALDAAAFAAGAFDAVWTVATRILTANTNFNDPTAAVVADAIWDEDIEAAHGTDATAGLLLRALGAAISNRANNATLDALLGVADTAGNDIPDQILDGDTMAELTAAIPASTPTWREAIMLLYMMARNKSTTTATLLEIMNDAEAVVAKQTLADNGTTMTRSEMVAGP